LKLPTTERKKRMQIVLTPSVWIRKDIVLCPAPPNEGRDTTSTWRIKEETPNTTKKADIALLCSKF
jgi:hypothetical protein